ncbi:MULTISPECIES: NADPH-dependent FMN reductase [unclassified Roseateles]|uniref:NADPH-dependent FMN reductase n=1 Tax=unclassified Roseateles TaxID=2626991 RepID=UPI0006FC066D|nr:MULTISPECIES: NADPH-dependent FMN reductase [unclassified Roseateles]KQW51343.1 NADPH-dependent FMN reductase [Pelomonas sp. Root405]KRA77575.1 NADPH-dependent FMN reductase [Pelomonas sp. Root662]
MHIIALSGALRRASYNTALLRAAIALAPEGVTIELRTLHGIPLYDGDVEAVGIPEAVTTLREAIRAADALLISTPEYNNAIPGVLKNGLDWLSRPSGEGAKLFGGKPTGLMGATPGGFGTVQSQDAMLSVFRTFGSDFWMGGRLMVSKAGTVFDADGQLVDEKVREQLQRFVHGFVDFVKRRQA